MHKIFQLFLFSLICITLLPVDVFAVDGKVGALDQNYQPNLSQDIPGLRFSTVSGCNEGGDGVCTIPWLNEYVAAIFRYGVQLAAVLAVIMIMVGGFMWLTSGGRQDRIGLAKDFITSALLGLFLALLSYLILYTVNPRIAEPEPLRIPQSSQIEPELPVEGSSSEPQNGGILQGSADREEGDICCGRSDAIGQRIYTWATPSECSRVGGGAIANESRCR